MPIAMEDLSITQHHDTIRYACICNGVYWHQLQRFFKEHYIYFQFEMPTVSYIKARSIIFCMKDVMTSIILLLES